MFSVTPMAQRFELKPGEVFEGSIKVTNSADAKSDLYYKAAVTPYSVIGAEYAADLSTMSNYSAIVDWIKIENPTGKLAPNESTQVKFKITVPENAAGGGQYATIAISSDAQAAKSEGLTVNNIFEMASVVYGNVDGEIVHEGEILENNIPGFVMATPVRTTASVTNNGNVHEDAKITITAKNALTGEQILADTDEDGQHNEIIMPGTERYVVEEVGDLPAVGVVHIEQTVTYLGETSYQAADVVICPIWFLVLMILAAGGIIAGVARAILKHRKKKSKKRSEMT